MLKDSISQSSRPLPPNYHGTPDTWDLQHRTRCDHPGASLLRKVRDESIVAPGTARKEPCGLCQPKIIEQVCSRCVQAFSWRVGPLTYEQCREIHNQLTWIYDTERARLFHQTFLVLPRAKPTIIHRYRQALGITQDELAKRWGMSRRKVSKLENGNSRVPADIAAFLERWKTRKKTAGMDPTLRGMQGMGASASGDPRKIGIPEPTNEDSETPAEGPRKGTRKAA